MNVRIRNVCVAMATLSALFLGVGAARAQGAPAGSPGQFGGSAPGQFDPNAMPGAQPGAAPGAPTPSPFGGMSAGGLTPPPPAGPNASPSPAPNDPTTVLDDSKSEDSGRGLTWLWAEVGGGIEHVGLQTIEDDVAEGDTCVRTATGCAEPVRSPTRASRTGTGPMIEGGLGVRVVFVTFGARGRIGFFETFDLATVGGELGFRIPIGSLEPRIGAGAGYAATMNGNAATGYYARIGGGLDYFLSTNVAIGGDVNGELVGLSVPSPELSTEPSAAAAEEAEDLSSSAGGTGLGVALGLHLGLHL